MCKAYYYEGIFSLSKFVCTDQLTKGGLQPPKPPPPSGYATVAGVKFSHINNIIIYNPNILGFYTIYKSVNLLIRARGRIKSLIIIMLNV